MKARKRFGQHFLRPEWIARVVAAIAPGASDRFLEIGPGRGELTLPLARSAAHVLAVEIDRDLAADLVSRGIPNLMILQGDVLTADLVEAMGPLAPVRVAGNLPYYVSTPVLGRLTELADGGRRILDATVMLQREVAERLAARPGTRAWGALSACQQMRAEVELLLTLPAGAFRPAPKVESAVVRLTYRPPRFPLGAEGVYDDMLRSLFTRRRKVLDNAIIPFCEARAVAPDGILERAAIDGRRRAETLDLAELARLARVFTTA